MKCCDCGHDLEQYRQDHMHGEFTDVVTCKNKDCSLWSVTLAVETYANLTSEQADGYRVMVANLKARFMKGAA